MTDRVFSPGRRMVKMTSLFKDENYPIFEVSF